MLQIEVVSDLPLLRYGVLVALGDLIGAPHVGNDGDGNIRKVTAITVLVVNNAEDWENLALRSRAPDTTTVALLTQDDTEAVSRAYALGAATALPIGCTPAELRAAVHQALSGFTSLSFDVVSRLLNAGTAPEGLSIDETHWLRSLSRGVAVKDLAHEAGYSERMMFRLLRDLYTKLGAHGRAEALLKAHQLKLL